MKKPPLVTEKNCHWLLVGFEHSPSQWLVKFKRDLEVDIGKDQVTWISHESFLAEKGSSIYQGAVVYWKAADYSLIFLRESEIPIIAVTSGFSGSYQAVSQGAEDALESSSLSYSRLRHKLILASKRLDVQKKRKRLEWSLLYSTKVAPMADSCRQISEEIDVLSEAVLANLRLAGEKLKTDAAGGNLEKIKKFAHRSGNMAQELLRMSEKSREIGSTAYNRRSV